MILISKLNSIYYRSLRTLQSFIPHAYRNDPGVLQEIYKYLIIGIFIKLLFIPFTYHQDLLSTYRRSFLLVFDGNLKYLNPHETIQGIWLYFISLLTPIQDYLVWTGSTTIPLPIYIKTFECLNIFRTIFLMKIPYLFFDISICILLFNIFNDDTRKGLRAFIFWFLNPIAIFAVYIFGRYEVIPIFFILACIYCIKEKKLSLASLFLGIAIFDRIYPLFILPLFIILCCRTWRERITASIICLSPLFIVTSISKLLTENPTSGTMAADASISGAKYLVNMSNSHFFDYLLGLQMNIGNGQIAYTFIVIYAWILLFAYYFKNNQSIVVNFTLYSLIVLLIFYATSVFHPHYFVWFIPFLAVYYGYSSDFTLMELHSLQVICFIFYTFYWGEDLSTWMFGSINPEALFAYPPPLEIIDKFYSGVKTLNIFRSLLTAVSLFMICKILYNHFKGQLICEQN